MFEEISGKENAATCLMEFIHLPPDRNIWKVNYQDLGIKILVRIVKIQNIIKFAKYGRD